MFRPHRLLSTCVGSAALALAAHAHAAIDAAFCRVAVDYAHNGVVLNTYVKDFTVQDGVPYLDDFSTRTRIRTFNAMVARSNCDLTVSIDYFNDVGVFLSVGFDTSLTIRGGGAGASTSGRHSTFTSTGVSPAVVGGRHTTSYTLSCRKA